MEKELKLSHINLDKEKVLWNFKISFKPRMISQHFNSQHWYQTQMNKQT